VRWIPIHDPTVEIGKQCAFSHVPLKLNPAGIFVPLVAFILATPLWQSILGAGGNGSPLLRHLAATGIGYVLVDGLLIVLFAFLYGLALFDPQRTARKLSDAGGSISGFPPGEESARYLRRVQTLLAAIGAVYLVAACVLPELICRRFYLPLPFNGFEFFLLAWLMVRIHERMRPPLRS
jgi:preprotein translocase subunit SecY